MNIMKTIMTKTRFFAGTGVVFAMLAIVGIPALAHAATFYRQMELGMTGTDISTLQSYLAQDSTIYPQGLVTGYFGSYTKGAVTNFQLRNDISPVGRVGPITLSALNQKIDGGVSGNTQAPTISSASARVNRNDATVSWMTNESSKGIVYYSTSPLSMVESMHSVSVNGNSAMTDSSYKMSQAVSITGLDANTTYYFMIHTTDQDGNVSVTWPSTFRTTN